ncbi:MAG: Hydrogen cyanide synthase subunit HcnB [Promethearchaeota archaeon]|nr:MAG: Hydrogen cyanide synthase subunit HcnB [Candidatus Lokiarchaeota archaeon]
MKEEIKQHPILEIPERKKVKFLFNGKTYYGYEETVISSVLFSNGIKIFGHHPKDDSPQGIFCANGQCAQCTVMVNGIPKKACMTLLEEGMNIQSCNGLPKLPSVDKSASINDPSIIETEVLVIGGGPAGLSAAEVIAEKGVEVVIVDDKNRLGGKLVLQTHKFFGSQEDVYAGKRGIEIAKILGKNVKEHKNVEIYLNSTALAVFEDGLVGILKHGNEYLLIKPKNLLVTTGAREKMLIFPGDTLPGVYGAGAFQTLVNRDLIKAADEIFIIGGGNVGLIAAYHALQAGIEVVGLIEAMPQCGGYKVHEEKLRRLNVPIFTNHTILSANGDEKVNSITIAKLDENWNPIEGTEKTFKCDTILIAVGLNPVDEFYQKAREFGIKAWIAGDAQEIAEASAAIFTGKIEGLKILENMGYKIEEDINEMEKKAEVMKAKPPEPQQIELPKKEEGIFPVFHCTQKIPCNPCTTVCPQDQIATVDDKITELPYFKDEEKCIGCGKCVAVCPGLAVTLVDYRKTPENPTVTFPYEMAPKKLEKGEKITVMGNKKAFGEFTIKRTRILKEFPHTQLISIQLPNEIAKNAVGITKHPDVHSEPLKIYSKERLPDEAIVCRCERVTAGEIRKWIRKGVTDINELKALTRASLGACGGKTCTPLIEKLYLDEGFSKEDITPGTLRPVFMEVPLKYFAGINDDSNNSEES